MASPTTIYLFPKHKKRLFQRARKRNTTFSDEVRSAVELYLEFPPEFDKKELARLAQEANASMDRSIARLDKTIVRLRHAAKILEESDRKLDELDRKHLRSA